MTLRLGVDAREISRNHPGGLRSYTRSLIRSLAEHSDDLDLHGYLDRKMPDSITLPSTIQWHICPPAQMAIREQFSLPRALRRHGIKVAHFPANTAPLRSPVPYVLTIHDTFCVERSVVDILSNGDIHNKLLSLYAKLIPKLAACKAGRVITVSDYSAKKISGVMGIPRSRIAVIPPAIDPVFRPVKSDEFRRQVQTDLGCDRFALILGSAQPRKNLRNMMAALREASSQDPGLGLIVTWTEAPDFKTWAVRNNIKLWEKVSIWNKPAQEDLVLLYSNSDVFLFVSKLEGFGLPVIEAMACGCPVITSNTSALPETAGSAAMLVSPEAVNEIADSVLELTESAERRQALIEAGLKRAADFCFPETASALREVYKDLE